MILTTQLAFSQTPLPQNQSDGIVSTSIATPFAPEEIYRFQPGLVTQLDQGTFGFGPNDRWFASGRLNTGSQTGYGLRYQVNGKALNVGYKDIGNINPRIEWIGSGGNLGDLEFRFASSFGSTNSRLSTAMRRDGSTVFSVDKNFPEFDRSKVGILARDVRREGLRVFHENAQYDFSAAGSFTARSHEGMGIGVFAESEDAQTDGYGVFAQAMNAPSRNFGVYARVNSSSQSYAIYGAAASTAANQYAGYFDGNVIITGALSFSSDRKLKENIKEEKDVLTKLANLNPVHYTFKKKDGFNLPTETQHGFIAQELEEVYPELVQDATKPIYDEKGRPAGTEEFKSVNYLGLISILTKSVQELNEKVAYLEEKLEHNKETFVVNDQKLSNEQREQLQGSSYSLEQNYPNPFEGQSVIAYTLPDSEKDASIMVFDMTGNLQKEYKLAEKEGEIVISSSDFKSGIYLYSLVSSNHEIITKRMIIN